MLEAHTIPANYRAILSHVQFIFPGSMIAGGALRDLDNGRPVKDIDVFAPDVNSTDDLFHRMSYSLLPGHTIVRQYPSYDDWGTREVVGVLDMDGPHGPYQLIGISTGPATILPRLDFGICQIGFDGQFIERSPAYKTDMMDQTFTLTRCDDTGQKERSVKHYDRLVAEAYQGWIMREDFDLI